ncbi:efflux RND transporter periplasmic adaptor subunit [Campylobacter sp. 19-13652]|uniref:efflux RND transporter periplasmic adaptor subunit n=1 Tax=Campylobacter sp. 19-13652 TaxID=2840180 RepID=UPI001C7589A3|nr:efflux RND transporter periplasmic adaptor subunit [Campylobacter sp. 19-13652]BCX79449.1 hemolysin D [Campylobacter sp. 19-13652]
MRIFIAWTALFSVLLSQEIFATFDVIAAKSASLATEASGVVKFIAVKAGDRVSQGDLLARLDTSSEEIALELAKSALSFAKSSFEKAKNARSVNSKQSFDEASFNLKQAELNVARLEDAISKKSLKAPFDGIIVDKMVEVGEGVGAISKPLFTLQEYPQVKLLIGVSAKYASDVTLGDEFKFNHKGKTKTAKITAIRPNINPKNQKIYLEALTKELVVGEFGEGVLVIK